MSEEPLIYSRPYYDDGTVTIYHADCRDLLPSLTADVLITDPPYGVGFAVKRIRNSNRSGSHAVGSSSVLYADDPETAGDLIRHAIPLAIAATTSGLIFCGSRMLHTYPQPDAIGAVYTPAGSGMSKWGFRTSQPILYYGPDPYLADGKGHRPNGFVDPRPHADPVDHPCPKPLHWMTWAVNRASRIGETVLDPFMGSGTTLLAAKIDGRRVIGIDISEHYCEIAANRLAQGVLDLAW